MISGSTGSDRVTSGGAWQPQAHAGACRRAARWKLEIFRGMPSGSARGPDTSREADGFLSPASNFLCHCVIFVFLFLLTVQPRIIFFVSQGVVPIFVSRVTFFFVLQALNETVKVVIKAPAPPPPKNRNNNPAIKDNLGVMKSLQKGFSIYFISIWRSLCCFTLG